MSRRSVITMEAEADLDSREIPEDMLADEIAPPSDDRNQRFEGLEDEKTDDEVDAETGDEIDEEIEDDIESAEAEAIEQVKRQHLQ